MLEAAMLFFGGVIAHKFASYIFDMAKRVAYFNNIIFTSLRMLKYIDETMAAGFDAKYELISEEKLAEEKEKDEKIIEFWRSVSIINLHNSVPPRFRTVLKFKDWREAMRLLDRAQNKADKQASI